MEIYQEETRRLDDGIVRTMLAQSRDEPSLWRIMTVWRSMEDLLRMRASGKTPRGVVLFQKVGAQPSLQVFEIAAEALAA